MLEFYPNLMNAGLVPGKIDSQTASLPVNNIINSSCSQTIILNKSGNNHHNENNEKVLPNGPTSATAPTLSNCRGQTSKL